MDFKRRKIFFIVGFTIGSFATFTGIIFGVLFSLNIEKIQFFISETFNVNLFPEEIYFLNQMPSEIDFNSIVIIGFCSIVITSIVSFFPSVKASNLNPIEALKYE